MSVIAGTLAGAVCAAVLLSSTSHAAAQALAAVPLAAEPLAAPHPAEESHGMIGVAGRLVPAAIRTSAPMDTFITGTCEGTLSPIGVILPRVEIPNECSNEIVLHHGWRDGQPGTYVFLDLPECSDDWCRILETSDKLRCEILIGNPCCMFQDVLGKELRAFTGTRIGPIADALQGRFDSDTDRREGTCPTWYLGNGARVLRVLFVEPAGGRGRDAYRVTGQGRLFLRERQGKSDDLVVDIIVPEPTAQP